MSAEFVSKSLKSSDHSSVGRFVWSYIRRHPWLASGLMIGAFSNAALAGVMPYFIGLAFDETNRFLAGDIGAEQAIVYAFWMMIAIIVSQTVRGVLQLMRNASAETYGQRIERDVRDELYASLLGKSMTFHDFQPVGEIMARVTNDVREMNLLMNPGINLLIGSGWFLIIPLFGSPLIHPQFLIIPLVFVVIHVITQVLFIKRLNPIAAKVRTGFGQMNARLAESLDGLMVVKGAAQENAEKARFNAQADQVRDYFIAQGRVEARYLSNLTFPLALVLSLLHGVALYNAGEVLLGDIVAFVGLVGLFGFPVFTSLNALSRIALGLASGRRILDIITTETELDRNEDGHSASIRGQIAFKDVDFGYLPSKQVLHDISFSVEPGQTVAIVGQTGAGKSTLTKLINRIYDVNRGSITVDGLDVREWNLESLRSQISIIEQDIFLFSRTIAENIAFGRPDATQAEIEDAARKAQAHDFIMSFNDGYKTVVGQRGVTLSGGQRQRIAIARAFLTNPPVLILDDSTSAIDSATEDKIQRAIYAAAKGRTTLLITHRLSQIRWADHIVVLRNGHVAAQGKHEHLLATSEAYRRIFARYEGGSASSSPETSSNVATVSGK
jgi:ATP-binding cassette subfamily B protein